VRKENIVKATFDFFEADILAKMGTILADMIYIQDTVAVFVFVAPFGILVATAAVQNEHGDL
jgi:hypothetical protein